MLLRLASAGLLAVTLLLAPAATPQTPATHPASSKAPIKKLPAAKFPAHAKHKTSTTRTSATKHTTTKLATARTSTSKIPASKPRTDEAVVATAPVVAHPARSAAYSPVSAHISPARTLATREEVIGQITEKLANPPIGIENAAQLRPFFDQVHQLELNPQGPVVRVLQFGDSHTAADMFTGALRTLFQTKWGDGGAGFSYAGYPFAGYRIHGTKRQQSIDWIVEGTHFRDLGDDAMVGMGGVSLSTDHPGSWVSLDADATSLQVQYLTQPGGGPIEIYDGDSLLATVSTDGPTAAGHFDSPVEAGTHHFEVRTTEEAPARNDH